MLIIIAVSFNPLLKYSHYYYYRFLSLLFSFVIIYYRTNIVEVTAASQFDIWYDLLIIIIT